MITIRTKLIFTVILFMVVSVSFAQSQPPSIGQTKGSNRPQEQIKSRDSGTENAKQKLLVPPVVTESSKVIVKNAETDINIKNENQSTDYILVASKVIKEGVSGESDLPSILLGIVVAYLTILISVAIAIFSEKKKYEALDRNVILDHIIKAKRLLLYLGLTFLPLLFWNSSLSWMRLLEIISWIIGVVFITKILFSSYHWMKGNKFQLRFDYLRELRNRQDMEEAWRSVWQTENINFPNEQEFFNIFQSTVNRLLENDER